MVVQKDRDNKRKTALEAVDVPETVNAPKPAVPREQQPVTAKPVAAKPAQAVKKAAQPDVSLEFDWEYTDDDLFFQIEDVVNTLVKEKKKARTGRNVPIRRQPRARARASQRPELSARSKIVIGAVVAVALLSTYPAYKYYKAYQQEQLIKERDRIKQMKEWREKEQQRQARKQYEQAARDYIAAAQDHLADADKLEMEKYAKRMYQTAKGYLSSAQQNLESERWQIAYENANSSILAFEKAKKESEVARVKEEERLAREKVIKARQALRKKFDDSKSEFKSQAGKALTAISKMEGLNVRSYYPIPYQESRSIYQKGIDKSKELKQWSSLKGKDIDEVLNKRLEIIQEAIKLVKQAGAKAEEASRLTKNKRILEQSEKTKRLLEKQKLEAERMRKLKEDRLEVKSK